MSFHDPKATESQIAAEIAARYGCRVDPAVVQRIPAGVSGLPQPVWDEKLNKLVVPGWTEYREMKKRVAIRNSKAKARHAEEDAVTRRQARVAELHRRGLPRSRIVAETGASVRSVTLDLQTLSLVPHPEPVAPKGPSAFEMRRDRIIALALSGMVPDDIALDSAVNLNADTVKVILRRAGITWARPVVKRKPVARRVKRPQPVSALKIELEALLAEGLKADQIVERRGKGSVSSLYKSFSRLQLLWPGVSRVLRHHQIDVKDLELCLSQGLALIADRLDSSISTIRRVIRAQKIDIGLHRRAKRSKGLSEERRARIARVVEMHASGMDKIAIGLVLGVSRTTVHFDLVTAGQLGDEMSQPRERRTEERRAKVAQMHAAGKTYAQIVAALHVSSATICEDMKALRLTGAEIRVRRTGPRRNVRNEPDSLAVMRSMAASGYSLTTIARRVGISPKVAEKVLAEIQTETDRQSMAA